MRRQGVARSGGPEMPLQDKRLNHLALPTNAAAGRTPLTFGAALKCGGRDGRFSAPIPTSRAQYIGDYRERQPDANSIDG